MIIFDIDRDAGDALDEWLKSNQEYAKRVPNFFSRVKMQLGTKPCTMDCMVERTKKGADIRVKEDQLSFYDDAKYNLKNLPLSENERKEMEWSLKLMRKLKLPEFHIKTTVKFYASIVFPDGKNDDWDVKFRGFPTLEEYFGFSPRILFNTVVKEKFKEEHQEIRKEVEEEFYKEYYNYSLGDVKRRLKDAMVFATGAYIAANAYLYYANKEGSENKLIRANMMKKDENKVIVFRVLKETKEIYAVETEEHKDKSGKVWPVRGHLRRIEKNAHFKQDKVVWIDSFVKGMPEEYYKEKRKERRKKGDALKEDPKDWITYQNHDGKQTR